MKSSTKGCSITVLVFRSLLTLPGFTLGVKGEEGAERMFDDFQGALVSLHFQIPNLFLQTSSSGSNRRNRLGLPRGQLVKAMWNLKISSSVAKLMARGKALQRYSQKSNFSSQQPG